ncbi:aminotransferase-like domain-containing protein [Shewanella colwelliana]|uniref:aminotransferase-like domain-containing protein n=1 Tax=Shewanella colwelliana TaxID=23 RepID=UPI003736B1F7
MGTIWMPNLADFNGPKYQQLTSAIEAAIQSGEIGLQQKLPPQRRLADVLGVTVGTVTRAYALAEQRGYVEAKVGDGTYVKSHLTADTTQQVNLATCQPPLGDQTSTLSDILADLAKEPAKLTELMGYHANPLNHHQRVFHRWLTYQGISHHPEQILFTHGAQQGIFTLLNSLLQPGEVLLHEAHCYPGIKVAATQLNINHFGIPLTSEGVDLEALTTLVKQHQPKAIYLTLNNQNPTCIQYSMAQRIALLDLAVEHQFYIIEDDVNYCLPEEWHLPLWQQAQQRSEAASRQVVYLSSLSKRFGGGLRQGFMLLPTSIMANVKLALHSQCWMVSPLNVEIAARVITSGKLSGERDTQIRARQQRCKDVFNDLRLKHRWRGLNGWIQMPTPIKAHHLVTALAAKGILVRNGDDFDNHDNYVRISIGGVVNDTVFEQILQEIKHCITNLQHSTYSVV